MRIPACHIGISSYLLLIIGMFLTIFMSPFYINIVIIYSMANLHDISWGNREINQVIEDKRRKKLKNFRTDFFSLWSLWVFALTYICLMIFENTAVTNDDTSLGAKVFLYIGIFVSIVQVLIFVSSSVYFLYFRCFVQRKIRNY